jgi:hypothetical protein
MLCSDLKETRLGKEREGGGERAYGVSQSERVSWLHDSQRTHVGAQLDL